MAQFQVACRLDGPFKKKSEEEKCSYLLLWIGDKCQNAITWTLTEDERKVLKTYYDRFQAYVEAKVNVIFARYKFQEKVQGANGIFATRQNKRKSCAVPQKYYGERQRPLQAVWILWKQGSWRKGHQHSKRQAMQNMQ